MSLPRIRFHSVTMADEYRAALRRVQHIYGFALLILAAPVQCQCARSAASERARKSRWEN